MQITAVYTMPQFKHSFYLFKSDKYVPTCFNDIALNRLSFFNSLKQDYVQNIRLKSNEWSSDYIDEQEFIDSLTNDKEDKSVSVDMLGIQSVPVERRNDPHFMKKCLKPMPKEDVIEVNI